MAVTASVLTTIGQGTAAATNVTGSFTPAADSKLVVVVCAVNNGHTTAKSWTISGGSLSWAQLGSSSSEFENAAGGADFDYSMAVFWADVGGSPGSMTVRADPYATAPTGYTGIVVFEVVGSAAGVAANLQAVAYNAADTGTVTVSLGSAPTAGSAMLAGWFALSDGGAPTWNADPADWTSGTETTTGVMATAGLVSTTDADGSLNHGYTGNQNECAGAIIEIGVGVALAQSAYRFGLDDGNEAAHTFAAAQDTPITVAAGQRRLLRVQVNETGGADATTAYTLQYKRSDEGADQWRDL